MTEEEFEKWRDQFLEFLSSYLNFNYCGDRNLVVLSIPKNYTLTSSLLVNIPSELHYEIGIGKGDRPLRLYIYR